MFAKPKRFVSSPGLPTFCLLTSTNDDNTAAGACKIATPLKIPVFFFGGNLQALHRKHGLEMR